MTSQLTDHEVEVLLTGGLPAGRVDLVDLHGAIAEVRDLTSVPAPSAELAAFMEAGLQPVPRPVATRRQRVAAGLGAVTVLVAGLGAAGALPAAAQDVFDRVVSSVPGASGGDGKVLPTAPGRTVHGPPVPAGGPDAQQPRVPAIPDTPARHATGGQSADPAPAAPQGVSPSQGRESTAPHPSTHEDGDGSTQVGTGHEGSGGRGPEDHGDDGSTGTTDTTDTTGGDDSRLDDPGTGTDSGPDGDSGDQPDGASSGGSATDHEESGGDGTDGAE